MNKKPNIKKLRNMLVNFGMLDDAIHGVLNGVQAMFDSLRNDLDKKFEKLDTEIKFVHSDLKHQIDDLKHDTPSMSDFNKLKNRVDLHYPLS